MLSEVKERERRKSMSVCLLVIRARFCMCGRFLPLKVEVGFAKRESWEEEEAAVILITGLL